MSLCAHGYTANFDCPICPCPCGSGKPCGECVCSDGPDFNTEANRHADTVAERHDAAKGMSADCVDGFCHLAEARGEHYRCQGRCAYEGAA